jgi:hypothetical protein
MPRRSTWLEAVQLGSLLFTALMLVPAGAHLFELPNKMALSPADYMTVQTIYRGWALFGAVIVMTLLFLLAHTLMVRGTPRALSLTALLLVVATQIVFWAWTYPMNAASANWTATPAGFEAARRQWEYSHAAGAALLLAAFVALVLSVLASRPRQPTLPAR